MSDFWNAFVAKLFSADNGELAASIITIFWVIIFIVFTLAIVAVIIGAAGDTLKDEEEK